MRNNSEWRFSLWIRVACAWLVLTMPGCDRSGSTQPNSSETAQSNPATAVGDQPNVSQPAAAATASTAPKGKKVCFQCNGSAKTACIAPGCRDGMVDCPGPCMKLSSGAWEHMHVDGHPDTEVWKRFHQVNGTSQFYNQNHVGEVVEMRAGMAVNIGKCSVCGGTAKVKCSVCGGTGRVTCPICEGKGFVPDAWTAFNNPKQKNPPSSIQLKDGRTLYAKIESRIGSIVYIRTESGKQEELLASDIVSTTSSRKN
jgi:hypothetical protein